MNKHGFEFSFAWLFAIFVGALILFFSIHIVKVLVHSERYQQESETVVTLNILFEPFSTAVESGKAGVINFRTKTKIYNKCYLYNGFGWQEIKTSSEQSLGKEVVGVGEKIKDKYIFSPARIEGEKLWLMVFPFHAGFKVADLLVLTSRRYCFFRPPNYVKEKIEGLSDIIEITETWNCSKNSVKVCFDTDKVNGEKCDVAVYGNCIEGCEDKFEIGYVKKHNITYYSENLMFAAIFSDDKIYKCNLKRLAFRISTLADMLYEKAKLMNYRGCNVNPYNELVALKFVAENMFNATNPDAWLWQLREKAKMLEEKNEEAICKLY